MRRLRAWLLRAAASIGSSPTHERALDDELHAHVQLHVDDNLQAGMMPENARREALAQLGGVEVVKERYRDRRGLPMLDSLAQDVRYALRTMRKSPGFALIAILTLVLGIGATTALFSIVYAVLVNPFSFEGADRMVNVRLLGKTGPPRSVFLTARQLMDLRKADVIDDAIAIDIFGMTLTGGELPEFVRTQFYSSNGFTFLGVRPSLGRVFTEVDALPGEEPRHVVVLTHGYWQRRYGGRGDVVGQIVHLDQVPYTVIGVTPQEFLPSMDVIIPIHLRFDPSFAWSIQTRLKPGVDKQMAEARLQPLFRTFAAEAPTRFPRDFRVEVTSLIDQRRGANFVPTLVLIFAASVVLLFVACLTISILLLARGAARQHEFAVRSAIGASRRRLLRQLLTESLLLAATGTALGVFVAYWGTPVVLEWLPPNSFPLVSPHVHVNTPVLLFSAGLAFLTGVVFGLSPALSLSRSRATGLIQSGFIRVAGHVDSPGTHHALIVVQAALTVLLLAGTGAAVRGLLALYQSALGYDPTNVLLVTAGLPESSHPEWSERAQFVDRLRGQIAATPQIESVGLSIYGGLPPRAGGRSLIEIPGQTVSRELFPIVLRISSEYLAALKIPLALGRVWSPSETAHGARVAVINQTMARVFWPDGSPIGQRVRVPDLAKSTSQFVLAAPGSDGWVEVVGVVGDTPNVGLREPPAPAMYIPYTMMLGDMVTFTIRTTRDPLAMARSVREQVRMVDPNQAVTQITTAEQVLAEGGWARERFVVMLLLGFGAFALVLGAVGLFSVVSFAVSQRVREFGIRMALGARGRAIVRLALTSPLVSIAGGLTLGIALTIAANKVLARWSIGNLADPVVLLAVAAVLVMATVAAVLMPAARAISIQPARALRVE